MAKAGNAHDDHIGIGAQQDVGPEIHFLQCAGPVILDEYVGAGEQTQKRVLGRGKAQVENDGALIAGVGLPVQLMTAIAPIAQGIAIGRFHFDHVGAEIGELEGEHVARNQPGKIEHPQVRERAMCVVIEVDRIEAGVRQAGDPQAMR